MNWKFEAIEKLKQYTAKKHAVQSIPEEIKRLEAAMQGIRSGASDGIPVQGGGSKREDMYLSNIVQREELERSLDQAEKWISFVDAGLEILNEEERLVLDLFYIHPTKGAAEHLAQALCIDVKTVYKRKDNSLRHFTVALYGGTET